MFFCMYVCMELGYESQGVSMLFLIIVIVWCVYMVYECGWALPPVRECGGAWGWESLLHHFSKPLAQTGPSVP